jgi:hypothetical protein
MKNAENFYRIYLSSFNSIENNNQDILDTSWNNCSFNVTLPITENSTDLDWYICVESFCMNQTPLNAYLITCNIPFTNNYSVLTGSSQSILLLNNQSNYHAFIYNDIMGQKISTPYIFNNTILKISILEADLGTLLPKSDSNKPLYWNMSLILYSKKN